MSEPKRYDRREIYDVTYQAAGDECLPEPSENGEFVRWEDYARLKAEVERLRKAGDAMVERINIGFTEVPWKYGPKWYAWHSKAEASVQAWNAAKEGKSTK